MASPAGRPDPTRALETLLDALFDDDSLERTLEAAARSLVAASAAEAVALFLFEEGRPVIERWHPENAATRPEAAALRVAAQRAAAIPLGPEAAAAPDLPGLTLLPLVAHGHRLGSVCLLHRDGPFEPPRGIHRITRAIACRAATDLEIARGRALRARHERWFKTLDEQLRVLDRERQKFAAIVHASDAAVFVTDLERTIRWTNSVMAARPPSGASSWIGMSCRQACRRFANGGASEQCEDCPVAGALRDNAVIHREYRQVHDGAVRSLYLSVLPIRGPHGRPEEAMVMIQDLSDLEILRASEARYRLLFERSSKAIVMVDPSNRRIVLANPTASAMSGFQPDELLRFTLEDLHPEAEWRRLAPEYAAALNNGGLAARECRLRTRDGAPRHAIVTGTRTDLDGRQVLMLEFRDTTEAKRVQEALHLAEARLRSVVAGSPIVLFAVDRDGIFTVSEGRGLARLGLKPGQVVGQSVFEAYRDFPQVLGAIRRALAGEEITQVVEVAGLAFDTSYAPLQGTDGQIHGVIGVATDVTERRRLEDQLRQSQRMEAIGRLAGGVAHDFNNLLAAMLGHSELMIRRLEPGHPLRRNAEEVQKAATRGAMLTRQLLAFGRKEVLSLRVLDLNAVVAGMDAMLRRLIGEDIQLETIPAPRAAPVRADRGQVEQVIVNLVVNARDAMPQGGKLAIEVSHLTLDEEHAQRQAHARPGPYVALTVTDTGCGMDAETLAHVFEPFFTTKERDKGTGLGLATVYGIVEQSRGHVAVESEPGKGARFRVVLPRAEEKAIVPEPPMRAEQPARGGTETVLLVEDEDAVRATAREALESSGYTVIEGRNGVEALQLAQAYPGEIHLLVTDVVMPRLGGGELAQKLLKSRPGILVLFVSGYPDDELVRHGVAEHGSPLLPKPFTLADLTRKVREVLDSRKAA